MSNLNNICSSKIIFNYNKSIINTIGDNIDDILSFSNKINNNTGNTGNNVFDKIYNICESNPEYYNSLNFVSIGSASNIQHKYYNILPPKDNHQLPPCIYNIIDNIINHSVGVNIKQCNIFLIDDRIEDPPYIVNNSYLHFERNNECWTSEGDCKINVYILHQNIYNYDTEITYIRKIYDKINNGLFIINDYSGLEIDRILDYKFDRTLFK